MGQKLKSIINHLNFIVMRKLFLFTALVFAGLMFSSCEQKGSTPEKDSTKLWPAVSNSLMGYINQNGTFAIQPIYDEAYNFSCGYALARISGGNLFFIDANGNTMTKAPVFDRVGNYFYYNCCRYQINNMWGLMDVNFKTVIQPAYYELYNMTAEGLVLCRQTSNAKYGWLDKNGKYAISTLYDDAWDFEDGVAVVKMGDNFGAIDTNAKFAIAPTYPGGLWSIGEGRIGYYDPYSQKEGMLDTHGNIIVAAMYDEIESFADNGLVPVAQNNQMGYLDKNGQIKLPFIYLEATPFYEGIAWIMRTENSNVEAIDVNGNTVLTLGQNEYPDSYFHNGLCLTESYSNNTIQYRYIDKKGQTIYVWTETIPNNSPAKTAHKKLDTAKLLRNSRYAHRYEKERCITK